MLGVTAFAAVAALATVGGAAPLGPTAARAAETVGSAGKAVSPRDGSTGKPAASPVDVGTRLRWSHKGVAHLLWTGFRATPSGGEVLLQTSASVELVIRETKDGPVFTLKRCRPARRNELLPLDTRYFDSTVTHVMLHARGADLEVAVTLRHPATAIPRREAGPNGSTFWVLAFAAPGAGPTAAATP